MTDRIDYDEFSMFHENAEEFGLEWSGPPVVRRTSVDVGGGRQISALVWGTGEPELALLHGGSQNAHTWDTFGLALDRPLVAIDLPGHGHSADSADGSMTPAVLAPDVAAALASLAPEAKAVVGMSLGGLTALAIAAARPELVRALVLVDITPGVTAGRASAILDFVNGPATFASFDELLARTVQYNPTRSVASLRRGILHNAVQRDDGTWAWRHARRKEGDPPPRTTPGGAVGLWDAVSGLRVPLLLVRGMERGSVVDDADEAELVRRAPHAEVVRVYGAAHSVQGSKPVELARLVDAFVPGSPATGGG